MYNTLMADQQPGEVIIPIDRSDTVQPPQVVAPSPSFDVAPQTNPAVIPPHSAMPIAGPEPQIPAPVEHVETIDPIAPQLSQPAQPTPDLYTPQPSYTAASTSESITWQSAEYFAHDKNSSWYGAMVLGSFLISVVVYILNRDIITALIVLISLVGLTYFGGRKPREQQFVISVDGVQVGHNYYAFHDFRTFSVTEDVASISIVLVPLKRFMPAVNIYVPTEYEERVVSFISAILPYEQRKADAVDTFMRRIKF